ncbi:MAG: alpha-hydroxy-acid oxidizing protein [Cyanothece sp. SIO1E1]|nr:alpha-hydroxy-acid oxidizing protein [Cyanothece sp. SIO1E1]
MRTTPINLFEYESQAQQHLSAMAWDYYISGAWDEITLQSNRAAFAQFQLRPRMLTDVSQRNLSIQLLGQPQPLPILIAPMAFQCLAHPEGEIATAKAAALAGAVMVLSTMSTQNLEVIAQARAQSQQWFQLYIHRDRALTRALVERAEAAGYSALCLTVDTPVLGCRERDQRNQFTLPSTLELANLVTLTDLKIPALHN